MKRPSCSYCDYKTLLIAVNLKQLWYFLKKQQLTGRFENPNDLYLTSVSSESP